MSGPFSPISSSGQPLWTLDPTVNGGFVPVTVSGAGTPEVGYGQGGYGQDGYDAPGTTIGPSAQPNWTVEVIR